MNTLGQCGCGLLASLAASAKRSHFQPMRNYAAKRLQRWQPRAHTRHISLPPCAGGCPPASPYDKLRGLGGCPPPKGRPRTTAQDGRGVAVPRSPQVQQSLQLRPSGPSTSAPGRAPHKRHAPQPPGKTWGVPWGTRPTRRNGMAGLAGPKHLRAGPHHTPIHIACGAATKAAPRPHNRLGGPCGLPNDSPRGWGRGSQTAQTKIPHHTRTKPAPQAQIIFKQHPRTPLRRQPTRCSLGLSHRLACNTQGRYAKSRPT
jgi:hypothetical protein